MQCLTFSSLITVTASISCMAGQHKFLQDSHLDKHECPERSACFVYITTVSNSTQITNSTNIAEVDAFVERGCLEESEVPLFYSQIQCRQLLNLQKKLTITELLEGQRCACTTDFCNTGYSWKSFLVAVLAIAYLC